MRDYIWNGLELVGIYEGNELFYVRTDHIARPVFATDANGTVVWEASYLPFGGVQTSTGGPDLRFAGQWFQSESGLHQNWMRDYDPTLGRYLQADPLGLIDGPSIYGYALQNPGRYTDPTGEFIPQALWCLANPLCRTAAGAAIGVLVGYVLHDDDCYTWRDALIDGGMGAFGAGVGNSLLRNYGSRSLTRQHGFEWSHSIPSKIVKNLPKSWQRQLNQRGGSNGNWVTPVRHYKHDPNRWIKNYESFGPRLPRPVQLLDRVPAWVWATVGGGAIGGASRTNIENRQ